MMRTTDFEGDTLRRGVVKEYPEDEMMQELHLIRLLLHQETRDMDPAEIERRFQQEQGTAVR